MVKEFDVIVIGVGMAGLNIARRTRAAGKSVAVVDELPYGGTCMLRGCDPKKVLVGAAEVIDWQRRMQGNGIVGQAQIDWGELMQFKRTFTDNPPKMLEKSLSKSGITTLYGSAQFIDENTLQIGDETFVGENIVIATGAKPRPLGISGEEFVATSTDFLELEELPERLVFIGGGYISFEFAHIANRAGAQVTILHRGNRPLEGFDADLVAELTTATEELGIDVQLQVEVTAVEQSNEGYVVQTADGLRFDADLVIHGAGRVPAIDNLNLEKAGIEFGSQGIIVNEYLQSISNPAIYAAGDVAATDGIPLTPVAVTEGIVVANNILNGNERSADYTGTPSVVFTIPALARVGLTEAEASEQGLKFTVNHQQTSSWYSSRRTNEKHTGFKVLVEEGTERILGAHLLGAHAGEVINMFVLAIRHNLTASDLKRTIYVHPAESSDISYMV
ncbi:NAD(P)/FAD-dependent oxidoreductase [Phototrophicus methaneseepsis]|uniref:NAD(P)/FAD-dependent oxidoreductase n=1 Tax=Phototrophicus methaneseepsis TaxID=2710758 RepID=A0A7S8EA52_9CHLR|nr:NAD(P)/FAD-dependent oxidoreductase [Phototrophicus methaneseepsis]QPC83048.1 NAD(P)/FAD-dependent oxidoreductase [Phototrophicus methaneseepsis]